MAVIPREAHSVAAATSAYLEGVQQRRLLFEYWAGRMHVDPAGLLPSARLIEHMKQVPLLMRVLFRVATRLWPVAFPVILTLQAARAWLRAVAIRDRPRLHGDVALVTTSRMPAAVRRLPTDVDRPRCWVLTTAIRFSKRAALEIPEGDVRIDVARLATTADVVWAASAALHADRALARRWPGDPSRLFGVELFAWCLFWRVLEAHGRHVQRWWSASHQDLWAMLIDRIDVPGERILVQHGIESHITRTPARLYNVNTAFMFDDASESYFRTDVLGDPESVRFRRLHPDIELSELPVPEHCTRSVLLIGHPSELDRERQLMTSLLDRDPSLCIFVKPHPLFDMREYLTMNVPRLSVIRDAAVFPRVTAVISPLSTLGVEYEQAGVPVVWHWDRPVDDVIRDISEVLHLDGESCE